MRITLALPHPVLYYTVKTPSRSTSSLAVILKLDGQDGLGIAAFGLCPLFLAMGNGAGLCAVWQWHWQSWCCTLVAPRLPAPFDATFGFRFILGVGGHLKRGPQTGAVLSWHQWAAPPSPRTKITEGGSIVITPIHSMVLESES